MARVSIPAAARRIPGVEEIHALIWGSPQSPFFSFDFTELNGSRFLERGRFASTRDYPTKVLRLRLGTIPGETDVALAFAQDDGFI
jgi:hypothetical protein